VIEKHVTLARADGGPDAAFSLEPSELAALVKGVRVAHSALGAADAGPAASEKPNMMFRRSLYVVKDVAAGETFSVDNVRSIRPGFGLPPKNLPAIIGRRSTRAVRRGTPLSWELIA
jgi:sialic acid synthase SpsE